MATNRLGLGTTNVPINLITDERRILGRLAASSDLSFGAFIRKLAVERLQQTHPEDAKAIIDARQNRRLTRLRILIETPAA
jgi:hypothetical protein